MSDDFHCVIKRVSGSTDAEMVALIRGEKCCPDGRAKCQNEPRERHTCPYLMAVYPGEPESLRRCNCCDECAQECAEDI